MAEHTQYVVAQILEAMQRRQGDVGSAGKMRNSAA